MARLCALYTGGKDSCYALHLAVAQGFDAKCLLTVRPRGWDSFLFHYPGIDVVKLHAEALGMRLIEVEAEYDEYKTLVKLLARGRKLCGCSFVSVGALRSDSQRLRFTMAAYEAGVQLFTPNWGRDQASYMRELVRAGIRFILVSVQAYGLTPDLLGRVVDEELVEEIVRRATRYGFNPAFEGGEAETLVVDAPLFKKVVEVRGRVKRVGPDHYVYEILEARLTPKAGGGVG
jgi:ABC transporter with metal-binding/Fe-S-binding domain ATP-binding protein